ncbi:hypothetical protein JCM8097_006321 [Rhodosporidiobolus ruineniae]
MDADMAPVAPSGHPEVIRALLKAVSALSANLDPVEGAQAKATSRVEEDIEEALRDYVGTLPAPVAHLLRSAACSLASSSPSSSFISSIAALQSLSTAVDLLSNTSTRPPASHRLPVELFRRIVAHVQSFDGPTRQQTNVSLLRTCRGFNEIVKPLMRTEMYLSMPVQLERLGRRLDDEDQLLGDGGPPALLQPLRTLEVDLKLAEIRMQSDGRWPGRHLVRLLEDRLQHLEVFKLQLHPSVQPGEDYESSDLVQALGINYDDMVDHFDFDLPSLRELHLPYASAFHDEFVRYEVFRPPPNLEVLRVGTPGVCIGPEWGELSDARRMAEETGKFGNRNLKSLSVPFWTFAPDDLLPILVPPEVAVRSPDAAPALQHLEATIEFQSVAAAELAAVADIFAALSPSVVHLSLRFRTKFAVSLTDRVAVARTVTDGLLKCQQLQSLEIGGRILDELKFIQLDLPHLTSLTFLQFHTSSTPCRALVELFDLPPHDIPIKHFTLALAPDPEYRFSYEAFTMDSVRRLARQCDEAGVEFRLSPRREEARWWQQDRAFADAPQ